MVRVNRAVTDMMIHLWHSLYEGKIWTLIWLLGHAHTRVQGHTQCPDSFQFAYLMMHTTHTLYQHTTSHANIHVYVHTMCASMLGRSSGVIQYTGRRVISKQLSVFWLISGQNSSEYLRGGMREAFMGETWSARRVHRQKATHRLRNDRKQGRKSKVSIR